MVLRRRKKIKNCFAVVFPHARTFIFIWSVSLYFQLMQSLWRIGTILCVCDCQVWMAWLMQYKWCAQYCGMLVWLEFLSLIMARCSGNDDPKKYSVYWQNGLIASDIQTCWPLDCENLQCCVVVCFHSGWLVHGWMWNLFWSFFTGNSSQWTTVCIETEISVDSDV